MSSLRRLCFVLPMDGDELLHDQPRPRSMTRRQKLLSCLPCGFCGAADDDVDTSAMASFEDIAGVYESKAFAGGGPRVFSYSELYIGTSGFSDTEVLGSGGFGRVYRAVLPSDGTTVAVKCVAGPPATADRFDKSFLAELAAVARLRHRNLVRLRGWCVRDHQELLLVYDYMPNRSLDRLLFAPPSSAAATPLAWDRRRRIVAGLAAALLYLHEQLDTQIIHRDVKTSNVMLDSDYNARLGDFGLARWLEHAVRADDEQPPPPQLDLLPSPPSVRSSSSFASSANYQFRLIDTSRIGGTIGYLPPESFQRKGGTATAKSDVFSFGIVLLEVATGRRAVDLAYPDDQIFMLDWARRLSDDRKLLNAGDRKLPPDGVADDMGRLIHLGLLCSLHDPRARPTMKWVVENISGSDCSADLPPLPSFLALPKYISLTSSSDSGTTTATTTTIVTGTDATSAGTTTKPMYATAAGTTIYLTAEDGVSNSNPKSTSGSSQRSSRLAVAIPNVDTPREISYKEIVAITNDFSESQMVAELDFGTGYHGFLDNGHGGHVHVLVKRLGMKTCPALRVRFANELRNLSELRHRNLVQLRGWCTEHGEMLVVYDYSPGNLLSHHLMATRQHSHSSAAVLSWRHRYGIVKALASAVLYLHEEWDEQVIHRNITSSAVFLDPDRSPRLGSFALAEFLSGNEHSHHQHHVAGSGSARGIFGYMSPEYMETGEATTMADVYSFGVVVLEVLTGAMAVDVRSPEVLLVRKVQRLWHQEQSRDAVEALVDRRLDDRFDRQELERMVKLGVACTRSDPAARPSMRNIVSILDGNDEVLRKLERRTESREEWDTRNAAALSLGRRFHALGVH